MGVIGKKKRGSMIIVLFVKGKSRKRRFCFVFVAYGKSPQEKNARGISVELTDGPGVTESERKRM
jgi:hypothetical protein